MCACSVNSVMSSSLPPHGPEPAKLLFPWDSPGKNTGVACQGIESAFPMSSALQVDSLPAKLPGKPCKRYSTGEKELPRCLNDEESTCQCRRCGFDLWVRKVSWRKKWQPTPVFLPGKSHGQRNLAGYSPGGCKESDMTQQLNSNDMHWESAWPSD